MAPELKARITGWLIAQRAEGRSVSELAAELGISGSLQGFHSLRLRFVGERYDPLESPPGLTVWLRNQSRP